MLTNEQLEEIREHLNKAQNPLFFFDNDCDGLISFILLRRYIGRGKGVAIKSFPGLDESYAHRIDELGADYIFILDKPIVSDKFFEQVKERNLPIVWIDHHEIEVNPQVKNNDFVSYYNPMFSNKKSSEPVSCIAYSVSKNKEDVWLAVAGCIADNFLPDFYSDFSNKYSELSRKNVSSAFEVLYETEFGKFIMILDFALKDRTSSVVSMINLLFNIKSPFDILKEDEKNSKILRRYEQVYSVYSRILDKAKKIARVSRKLVFFQYGGQLSLSANLANELSYRFPSKVIIVAYIKGAVVNISVRGNVNIRNITLRAIEKIGNATGGGHEHATGAKISVDDLPKFREFFEEELRKVM